jgi:hypothetical protein
MYASAAAKRNSSKAFESDLGVATAANKTNDGVNNHVKVPTMVCIVISCGSEADDPKLMY